MANETIFPDGIRTFEKKSTQPDFVLGDMIIEPDTLFAWCNANSDKLSTYQGKRQLKLNLTKSKSNPNKVNVSVNTYGLQKDSVDNSVAEPDKFDDLPF